MNKYLRYAILAGIFAIPFIPFVVANQFFFPFITGKNFTFRIIVEIIFALWIILALSDSSVRPKKSALWFALLLFVGSIGISTFTGENPHKSFWSNFERMEGWITILHLGAYFTVLVSMLKSEQTWKYLWNTSIGVSVLVALFGVLQLAGAFTINQGGVRVDATFGNATYLAVYMLFHLFMTLYALVRWNPAKWLQIGYAVAIVLQALMIFYAATRGTTLGLLGGLLLSGLIFALFSKGSKTLRNGGIALLAGVVVVAGGFFLIKDTSFVQNNDVLTRFASINLEEGQTRFAVWNMALQGVKERPVFGWGQENFNYVFNENYRASMYNQEPWFDRAHNQFLDWLVAGGVVGFALYISLYIFALWYLWRGDTFDVKERAIFTGLLAGYAFHSLFVFDNIISSVLFLGLLAYITTRHSTNKSELSLPTLSGASLSAAAGVVVVVLAIVFWTANIPGMARASNLINALQPQENGLQENFNTFKQVTEGGGIGRQEAHEQLVQFALQIQRPELQQLSTPDFRSEVITFTRDTFLEEINRNPEDARLRVFYGGFLRQIGDIAGAKEHLTKALELSPEKQTIMFELGLVASVENNAQEAVQQFQTAFELEPEYDRARILFASILIRVEGRELANQLLIERYGTVTPPDEILLQAYFDVADFEHAIAVAEARSNEAPADTNRLTQLAGIYLEAGERQKAIETLRAAIQLDPNFAAQGAEFISQIEAGEI